MRFFNLQGRLLVKIVFIGAICLSGCGNNRDDSDSGGSSGKLSNYGSVPLITKNDSVRVEITNSDSSSKLPHTKDDNVNAEIVNKEKLVKETKKSPGYFTDSRNNQKYRTITVGGKTWMAENLNYQIGKSWCYGNDNSNCKQYGRLYDRTTAKVSCPKGWHLPTHNDWNDLVAMVGGEMAGRALKSTIGGWEDGVDSYGFSALPGGYRDIDGSFSNIGGYGYWWTASGNAYYRVMYNGINHVHEGNDVESFGFSVRCLQN